MKRFSAHALSFLVVFACFAPAVAVAKSHHPAHTAEIKTKTTRPAVAAKPETLPPLPDRNPERVATPAATLASASPAEGQSTPGEVAQSDTGTETGALPEQQANPAKPAQVPQQDPATATTNVPLPDRYPSANV